MKFPRINPQADKAVLKDDCFGLPKPGSDARKHIDATMQRMVAYQQRQKQVADTKK